MIGWSDALLLLAAGMGAGVCGTVAGLASLASYPALLAVGLPPVTANVTNTVALIGNAVGSVAGSRPELRGQGRQLRAYAPLMALGGAAGAALLLLTPGEGFEYGVPVLILLAVVLLWLRPRIQARLVERRERLGAGAPDAGRPHWVARAAMFLLGVYGGYFGAGAGVMILAVLGMVTTEALVRVNAAKNVLLGLANGVAAVGFMVFGPVVWTAVAPLLVGCLVGGYLGPAIARAVPPRVLRIVIIGAGLALSADLAVQTYL